MICNRLQNKQKGEKKILTIFFMDLYQRPKRLLSSHKTVDPRLLKQTNNLTKQVQTQNKHYKCL